MKENDFHDSHVIERYVLDIGFLIKIKVQSFRSTNQKWQKHKIQRSNLDRHSRRERDNLYQEHFHKYEIFQLDQQIDREYHHIWYKVSECVEH